MIQKFIELGEGYADIYELIELGRQMPDRIQHAIAFYSEKSHRPVASLALIMKPTTEQKFQSIYICREGIPNPHEKPNQRFELFKDMVESNEKKVNEFTVKPSNIFPETELYYQYLIGILRTNKFIPPLS
ncbi:methylthioribose kinase [Halobacillus shinanisalinarum]|uniref:Methylthioribose kinase n=1 Tax=Halobacillus shinanisalinarum TaxID=2932258 RepID=A0ABY4GYS1_9BACI|nr:methylthioribose kinase [Halobacillus shinanisalinarum]UOQ93063.1 methylthioribose kinase [Halobacillus shinanisalinarum]